MKKIILVIIPILLLCGCNYKMIDLEYEYNKAICNYDGDKFELKINEWSDYDGEQIQIITDDNIYLVSANHCYLIKDKNK